MICWNGGFNFICGCLFEEVIDILIFLFVYLIYYWENLNKYRLNSLIGCVW